MNINNKIIKQILPLHKKVITKNTLPVLNGCLIRHDQGVATIESTDLDVRLKTIFASNGNDFERVLMLNAFKPFNDSENITLNQTNKQALNVEIKDGSVIVMVETLDAADYPPAEDDALYTKEYMMDVSALNTVMQSVSTDASRYVLNGVYFHTKDRVLIGTDGKRLSRRVHEFIAINDSPDFAEIVPTKACNLLLALSKVYGNNCHMAQHSENQSLRFTFIKDKEITRLYTKRVEGNFPNYKQVIPGESHIRMMEVDVNAMRSALKRLAPLTSKKSQSVRLDVSQNDLTITAQTPDLGSAKIGLAVRTVGLNEQGKKTLKKGFSIAVNPEYLTELLSSCRSEVSMLFTDDLSPIVIEDVLTMHVLMPMRSAN